MSINQSIKCKKNPLAFPSIPSKRKKKRIINHDQVYFIPGMMQGQLKGLDTDLNKTPKICRAVSLHLPASSGLTCQFQQHQQPQITIFLLLRFYFFHPLRPMFSAWASCPHIWFENYGQEESQLHLCAFPFSSFCAIYWVYLIPLISCFLYSEYFYSCLQQESNSDCGHSILTQPRCLYKCILCDHSFYQVADGLD